MKLLFLLLALPSILLQSFSSFIIVAHYEWNKENITSTFCENKSKPTLHCNGKCHLRKQLKAQEKKEQNPFAPLKDKLEYIQFSAYRIEEGNCMHNCSLISTCFSYDTRMPQLIVLSIYHPPKYS